MTQRTTAHLNQQDVTLGDTIEPDGITGFAIKAL
jgi:hypothetical protein